MLEIEKIDYAVIGALAHLTPAVLDDATSEWMMVSGLG